MVKKNGAIFCSYIMRSPAKGYNMDKKGKHAEMDVAQ